MKPKIEDSRLDIRNLLPDRIVNEECIAQLVALRVCEVVQTMPDFVP